MPAKSDLTWEQSTHRWKKVYKGRSYTVSCRALGVPPTKLESYQAANDWWATKRIEIDGNPPAHPNAQHLDLLSKRLAWAQAHGQKDLVQSLDEKIDEVRSDQTGELNGLVDPFDLPSVVLDLIDNATWKERLSGESVNAIPTDRTVGAQVDRFLALEQVRTESDQLSVSEFDTIRRCLHAFRDYVGKANPVTSLDADQLEGWWSHLVTQPISVEYKKKRLRIAKSFIAWLAEKGMSPAPPNLYSRRHRFGGGPKSIPTIPLEEVRSLIAKAPGQLKLHLLLMLNTGMTQVDISDLRPGEVVWDQGRIIRKRSKTADHEHVPIVEYPLWPSTWDLFRRFGRRDGERALLTESGRPWLRDELRAEGKRSKVDAIKSNYVHLQRKTGSTHPLKLYRKTSATMIESHEHYGRYVGHFLGHAPRSLADRHYAAPSRELFDKVIGWLGQMYGPAVSGG